LAILRIEKSSDGPITVIRLSGRIQSVHVRELQIQIQSCAQQSALDLEEVALVDRVVVRFLGLCESKGIAVRNCPLYIREWIQRENARSPATQTHDCNRDYPVVHSDAEQEED
jgi:hypothetical protein